MALFALYHYDLSKFGNRQLALEFAGESGISYESLEDLFESFLTDRGGSLNLYERKETGRGKNKEIEPETYKSEVLQHNSHIVAFRVQVNKTKTVNTENWDKSKVGHFPETLVLIDNRPDSRIIAIEKTTITDMDKVFNLLKENFNNKLRAYSVRFDCIPLIKHKDFWDAVDEIRERLKDAVRRVQFDFVGKETNQNGSYTDSMLHFVHLLKGEAQFAINLKNDETLKRVTNDLTQMADLCKKNHNYALTVKFRDFGLFRYGQDVKAQYGLADEMLNDYTDPAKELSLFDKEDANKKIEEWFDHIRDLFKDYMYEPGNDDAPTSMGFYIIPKEHQDEVLEMLAHYVGMSDKPQQCLLPMRAAIDAGCVLKPAKEVFEQEYDKKIASTSWKRYMGGTINPYEGNSSYNGLLSEFCKLTK